MSQNQGVQDNETLGLRLLKKSQKVILKLIFSRMGIILLMLLLNIGILFVVFLKFEEFLPHFYGGTAIYTVAMVIYLINCQMDPTAKITWLIVVMILPVFGSLLYLFTRMDLGHRAMQKRLQKIYTVSKQYETKSNDVEELSKQDYGAFAMTRYVASFTGVSVFQNTSVTYFPCGEEMFAKLLLELEKAKKSIYLEYFIIDEGIMWGKILEILAKKASQGVDVRVIYDGTCEFFLLPKGYSRKLKKLGISCHVFAPVTPFLSTHYNYRDHRKILTIDGKVAFNGGVNLADEYINAKKVYGHWKDAAVMLKGEAAKEFERMFLQMWSIEEKKIAIQSETKDEISISAHKGFVLP